MSLGGSGVSIGGETGFLGYIGESCLGGDVFCPWFFGFLGGGCYIKLFFKMKKIFQPPLEITRFLEFLEFSSGWLVHWRYLVESRQDDLAYSLLAGGGWLDV